MLTKESREIDFPSLKNRVYFNTAAEGIPPIAVVESFSEYAKDKLLGMDGRLLHEKKWRSVRDETAKLYGLRAEDIAICSCSSEAYNLIYLALRLKAGDEIIINDLDFPAGATPWLNDQSPATVHVWKSVDGVLRTEDLTKLLNPKIRIVTLSMVSFYNGYTVDLEEIAATIHQNSSALLAVDVTQALGRIPLQLDAADIIVSSTHKWILGSHGGCLIGINPRRSSELLVPAGGWFNLENAFEKDRFEKLVIKPGDGSFMVGMPNYAAIYPVATALKYINAVGVELIDKHAYPLVDQCRSMIAELPVEFLGPINPKNSSGIIAFKHKDYEAINIILKAENIHVMCHAGRIRIAIHGYNTESDVEKLVRTLQKFFN